MVFGVCGKSILFPSQTREQKEDEEEMGSYNLLQGDNPMT
jgi:hypothetical protein